MSEVKRLYLSNTDKKLAGVCGGLGEYFGIDPTMVRLAWIILTIATGVFPGILAYIIAALVIPKEPTATHHPKKTVKNENE